MNDALHLLWFGPAPDKSLSKDMEWVGGKQTASLHVLRWYRS